MEYFAPKSTSFCEHTFDLLFGKNSMLFHPTFSTDEEFLDNNSTMAEDPRRLSHSFSISSQALDGLPDYCFLFSQETFFSFCV